MMRPSHNSRCLLTPPLCGRGVTPRLLGGWLAVLLLTTGCTSQLQLPWEKNSLDASRIATREPLEVPPNLEILPPPTSSRPQESSAGNILFGNPVPQQGESPDRYQKEKLPNWMDATKNKSPQR